MLYEEYLEKFRVAQLEEQIDFTEKPWSREDFEFFILPTKETPELSEDVPFRLNYKHMYLTLKKGIEMGISNDKERNIAELEKIYNQTAEKLNLL